MDNKIWLTNTEAMELTGYSSGNIAYIKRTGKTQVKKVGNRIRIHRDDLLAYAKEHQKNQWKFAEDSAKAWGMDIAKEFKALLDRLDREAEEARENMEHALRKETRKQKILTQFVPILICVVCLGIFFLLLTRI